MQTESEKHYFCTTIIITMITVISTPVKPFIIQLIPIA